MIRRKRAVVLGLSAIGLPSLLAGCGDFGTTDASAGAGGAAAGTGGAAAGTGGAAAGTGGAAAGTGGAAAGTGGAAAGTGGAAAGTGGAAAGTGGADVGGMAGTGGSMGSKASCENVVGCGGDVVGVWSAVDSCLPISGNADLTILGIGKAGNCSMGVASGMLAVTGTWTFGDEIMTDNTRTTGTVKIGLGPNCKELSGTVTDCPNIGGPLGALGFADSECVDSTTIEGGCDCTGTVDQMGSAAFLVDDASSEAAYSIEGNTLHSMGFDPVTYDFCVDGNSMQVTPTTRTVIGTLSGTILFQKQP